VEEETLGKVEAGVAAFVRLVPKMPNIASIPVLLDANGLLVKVFSEKVELGAAGFEEWRLSKIDVL
jgi:hypothetical protein